MALPAHVVAAARSFLRAQLTGDRDLLARVCRPHPELAALAPTRPPRASIGQLLDELERLQVSGDELGGDRLLVRAWLGGTVHLLVVHVMPDGARVDARYAIEAQRPDDERRRVARDFYRAMLFGDAAALADLAFDARGVEMLAGGAPPPGERAQLEHVVATMGLVKLETGESFVVPKGVEFTSARHAELGIEVWSGLTPSGEIPFLLRRRDGAWKVIPFHFIQAAVLARGGTLAS